MTVREQFIEQIAPLIAKYAPMYGVKVISPIIAQAIVESGSGTSFKAGHHNYFGLKYRTGRCPTASGVFKADGSEQKLDGSYIPIVDDWFAFPSMEAGVIGYFDWLNNAPGKRYDGIKGVTDPEQYLRILKNASYATDLQYVEKNMAVIENCQLTRFDTLENIQKGDSTMVSIIKDITTVNRTVLKSKQNKYIVIHYTGNTTDKAKSNANYFRSVNRGASAHYFVDDTSIYQVVEDKDAAWAVGKNYGKNNLFGTVTNNNSISIEMCSTSGAISQATFNNTVDLTKMLMQKYGIPATNVYRHYDVCSKRCPGWAGWVPNNESLWLIFKNTITTGTVSSPVAETKPAAPSTSSSNTETYTVKILCSKNDPLAIRKGPGTNYEKVGSVYSPYKYTIVETKNNWGRLKSGKGWINVSPKYVQKL